MGMLDHEDPTQLSWEEIQQMETKEEGHQLVLFKETGTLEEGERLTNKWRKQWRRGVPGVRLQNQNAGVLEIVVISVTTKVYNQEHLSKHLSRKEYLYLLYSY